MERVLACCLFQGRDQLQLGDEGGSHTCLGDDCTILHYDVPQVVDSQGQVSREQPKEYVASGSHVQDDTFEEQWVTDHWDFDGFLDTFLLVHVDDHQGRSAVSVEPC